MLPLLLIVGVTVESPRELRHALDEGQSEIVIAPGVFTGNFTVNRPVHLKGSVGTILEGNGEGSVLTLKGDDITVEHLAVRHSGRKNTTEDAGIKAAGSRIALSDVIVTDTLFGITLEQCKMCSVDGAIVIGNPDDPVQGDGIKLWESHGSTVTRSYVEASRDVVVWYSRHVRLFGNTVTKSRYGTHFMYVHDVEVQNGTFADNVVGVFVMYSTRIHISDSLLAGARGAAGMGLGVKESEDVTVLRSNIVANTTGLYFDRAPRVENEPVRVTDSLIALNGVGVRLHSSQRGIELSGNDVRHNTSAIEVEGGGDALGLDVHHNHWSDYEGFDLDRDGTGDVAFEVKALSHAWTDEQPALAFFRESVAMHALDVVSQSLPLFASRLLVRDATPRMKEQP